MNLYNRIYLCDKGLCDSNILITYRKPRSKQLPLRAFTIQHSVSPDMGIHGIPIDNFSSSGSEGVNLCRFSAGGDLSDPASSNWSSKTSFKFERSSWFSDDLQRFMMVWTFLLYKQLEMEVFFPKLCDTWGFLGLLIC